MKPHALHLKKAKKNRKRLKREVFKAWMLPTRMVKEFCRGVKFAVMIIIAPFVFAYLFYRLITGNYHPVWDGG